MKIYVSEKNKLEMSLQRDFPTTTTKKTYCIFSTQRSGSTLLSRSLYDTGVAGDPIEYFNPPIWALGCQHFQNTKMNMFEFVEKMKLRRTSPNGVFGIKTHFSQLLLAGQSKQINEKIVNFIENINFFIRMRRKNKISQAVSNAIAIKTGVWSSEDSRFKNSLLEPAREKVTNFEISQCLQSILFEEYQWDLLIKKYDLKTHDIWYEDLVSDFQKQINSTLEFLEIEISNPMAKLPLQKQGDQINVQLCSNFIQFVNGEY
jgi:LPS sulfotransferase NodH